MKGYKLIFTDLDGTLLYPDSGSVTPENLRAIEELYKRGVQVIPCSGRPYNLIPEILRENPYIRYISTSNGAVIVDKQSSEPVVDNRLCAEHRRVLVEVLGKYDIFPAFHIRGVDYCDESFFTADCYERYGLDRFFVEYFEKNAVRVKGLMEMAASDPTLAMTCSFIADAEQREMLLSELRDTGIFRTAQSHPNNVEAFSIKAGKGNALRALAERLGVDISETVAVGDSNNDATMIEAAGLGLAVENALHSLKDRADEVICPHKDHVLDYILKHYIL